MNARSGGKTTCQQNDRENAMLKNIVRDINELTTIVISFTEFAENDINIYQATVRYITTLSCLTVTSVPCFSESDALAAGYAIADQMEAEYRDHKDD